LFVRKKKGLSGGKRRKERGQTAFCPKSFDEGKKNRASREKGKGGETGVRREEGRSRFLGGGNGHQGKKGGGGEERTNSGGRRRGDNHTVQSEQLTHSPFGAALREKGEKTSSSLGRGKRGRGRIRKHLLCQVGSRTPVKGEREKKKPPRNGRAKKKGRATTDLMT